MSNLDGIVRIGVDVQDQQATDAPNNIAQNFKRAFKLIGAVMAAFTAKNFINQTIQMAESARILNRTLTNTFGENYNIARDRMNGIANQFGMVNGRLDKEFATFSRSWLQMGYDIETSMDLAERQMRVAQNAAVGLGYEFDYTSERAKAFISGNYQAGVRLGAFATRTDVAAWAMENYGINMDDATAAQQKMMRLRFLEYMQELGKMSDYYNQGARDMANVQANINHEVERFQAIIGGLFLDTKVDMMINMVNALVWFNDILEGSNSIMDVAIAIWDGMSHTMQDATIAFGIFTLAIAAFNFDRIIIGAFDMMLAFEAKAKSMLLAAKNSKILGAAMAFLKSPFGIAAIAITALVVGVRWLYRNFEWFRDLVHGIMPTIKNIISSTMEGIQNVFQRTGEVIDSVSITLTQGLQNAISSTGEIVSKVMNGIVNGFGHLGVVGKVIDAFIDNVKSLGQAFIALIRDADPTLLLENIDKLIPMALKILIGGKPALFIGGMQLISTIADGMGKTVPELINKVTDMIVDMIERFGEWLPEFVATGLDILESIIQGILEAIPQFIETVTKVIDSLLSTIAETLPQLLETGMEILNALIGGLLETLPILLETGMELIGSLIETFMETLPELIESGKQILTALIDGIVETLPILLETGLEVIMSLLTTILSMLPQLLETGMELLLALIDGIKRILPVLIDSTLTIIASLISTFLDALPQLLETGMEILNALIDGIARIKSALISTAWDLMADFIAGIASRIFGVNEEGQESLRAFISGIGLLLSQVPLIGRDIVQGLIDGITGMFGSIGDTARQLGSNLLSGVRGFLGINSPSREMMKLGQSTAQGLSRGLDGDSRAVEASVRQMTQMMNNHARQGTQAFLQVFRQMGTNLINQQRSTVQQITSSMNPLPNNMRNSGVSAMNGLINGMNAQRGAVLNTARNIANEVTRTIQGALRISSPSMVMRDEVGKWIPLGIADGIDKYSDAIKLPSLPPLDSQFNIPNVNISRDSDRNGRSEIISGVNESNQRITVEVPVYLNSREIAREIADDVTLEQNNNSHRQRTFRGGLI